MKISRINIKSFGVIKNWKEDIDDNLTVVYGDNETGKSTITEFIRSTLFPSNERKLYPVRDQTDSGNITVKMDNGDTKVLLRKGKKVTEDSGKKTVADEIPEMDAETYRYMYGLDLVNLNKMGSISKDVSKLLAIPGGENVPNVLDLIEEKMNSLMNKRSVNSGSIGHAKKEIETASNNIAIIHSDMNLYSQLVTEKKELEKKVSDIDLNRQKIMNDHANRAKKEVVRSQIDNLEKLKQNRINYAQYKDVPTESRSCYERLKGNIDELGSKIEKYNTGSQSILEHRGDIENVWKHANQYYDDVKAIEDCDSKIQNYQNEITQMEKDLGRPLSAVKNSKTGQDIIKRPTAEVKIKRILPISLSLMATVAAFVAIGFLSIKNELFIETNDLAMIIAGIFVGACIFYILYRFKRRRQCKIKKLVDLSTNSDNVIKEKNEYEQRVNEYTRKASLLLADFDYATDDIVKNVNLLHDELEKADSDLNLYEQQINEEKDKLAEFLKEYGDEKSFLDAYERMKEYWKLDLEIKTLSQSIEESTFMKINDFDVFVNSDDVPSQPEDLNTSDMSKRIGLIEAKINDIMDEGELDKQLQKKMKYENEFKEALREWAKLSIAKSIIKDACNFFYDNLQPDVVKDANRYLSLMTGDRYKFDHDPGNKEPVIRDNDTKKSDKEWSSGLRDQVCLSLKMAMARRLRDEEKLPLILDDVLVRFDNDRKIGACRAIYEFSKESQVIIFTCDNSLRDFFNDCGKHTEILLPNKSSFREVVAHE